MFGIFVNICKLLVNLKAVAYAICCGKIFPGTLCTFMTSRGPDCLLLPCEVQSESVWCLLFLVKTVWVNRAKIPV